MKNEISNLTAFESSILFLVKVTMIVIAIIVLIVISDSFNAEKQRRVEEWKYEEVYIINDVHSATLDALGIDEIYYYDWEETAHSLDVPLDSLTINMFLKHLLHHD